MTKWPKSVAINYKKTFTFLIGNFSADVRIEITKIKNKVTIKTALLSAETTTVENKTSPWDLWCPAEGTIIWGDLNGPLIVNDSLIDPIDADSYKECARRYGIWINSSKRMFKDVRSLNKRTETNHVSHGCSTQTLSSSSI